MHRSLNLSGRSSGLFGSDGRDDLRRRLLNPLQTRGKRLGLAVVELNVVACSGAGREADGLADDERHRFGFGFPNGLGGRPIFAAVEQFVGQFMHGDGELLALLAGI